MVKLRIIMSIETINTEDLNLIQILILIKSAPYFRNAKNITNKELKKAAKEISLDNVHPNLMRKVYLTLESYSEDTLRDFYFLLNDIAHA